MESHWVFCLRLLGAALLGGLIGLEREISGKPSGLRTNALICVGAALFTHVSLALAFDSAGSDPGRIAAQIVTGIGFLGAGVHHDAILATLLILAILILARARRASVPRTKDHHTGGGLR